MSQTEMREKLTDILTKFTGYSGIYLPDDVQAKLKELRAKEDGGLAEVVYDAMFEDLKMAADMKRPICQDTGVIQYFVEIGSKFPMIDELEGCLREATVEASAKTPLRPNVVEIFDEKNTNNNAGYRIPWIDWELVPNSDEATIYVYMAGGGCSLPGIAKVFPPLEGYEAIMKFVFDQVSTMGINACPPLLVGVGIAGSTEVAAKLAKKALMRPIGSHNSNARGAELEGLMEEALNKIGIGPGGVGGASSVMGVNIEQAGRHPSTLAAALALGCWAHRRAAIKIGPTLDYKMITHEGATL